MIAMRWGSVFYLRICPCRDPGARTCSAPEMADEKPSPWFVLPHFTGPGTERIVRPGALNQTRSPLEDVDPRAAPPWTVRRNVSPKAIYEGQRMTYHMAGGVAEPGLERPENRVFDARGTGRVRWRRCGNMLIHVLGVI